MPERHWESFESPDAGLTSMFGEPGVMPHEHRHQEIELNFLTEGSMTYLFSGTQRVVPAGRLAVFWATFPHQVIRANPNSKFYCLYFPLAWLLQWQLPGDLSTAILNGGLVVDSSSENMQIDQALMPRWHADIQHQSPEHHRTINLEIEARLRRLIFVPSDTVPLRLAGGKTMTANAPGGHAEFDKLERMTSYIAANYTEPLDIEDVAREVNLHPKYIMGLFRKNFGMTIVDYITQHRISHAQRLLATTAQKVIDIGFDAGFGSTSRFYEAFDRACGLTPRAFRRSVQGR